MNHLSEWMKFFYECAARYHYRHIGLAVIHNTLMAIGKVLKKKRHDSGWEKKKTPKWQLKKRGKNLARWRLKRGLRKFNKCRGNTAARLGVWTQKTPKRQSDTMLKLSRILANQLLNFFFHRYTDNVQVILRRLIMSGLVWTRRSCFRAITSSKPKP